jgi:hypothetical protein
MTFRRPKITEDDLPGPGQFRLVVSRNLLGPGKSSSVNFAVAGKSSSAISPFSVSHLTEYLGWEECGG